MLIFAINRHIVKYSNSHKYTNTCIYSVGTKLNTSFGTKLKIKSTTDLYYNILFVCQLGHNMLIFAIIGYISKYGNSRKYINTFVYAVGTKLNTLYRTKQK